MSVRRINANDKQHRLRQLADQAARRASAAVEAQAVDHQVTAELVDALLVYARAGSPAAGPAFNAYKAALETVMGRL